MAKGHLLVLDNVEWGRAEVPVLPVS